MNFKSKQYWIVITLLVLTGIYVNILRYTRVSVNEIVELTDIPKQVGDWRMDESYFLDEKTLNILKSDKDVWRQYSNSAGQVIGLFVAYFKDQKYGAQIHSPIHCMPGGGWKIINRSKYSLAVHSSSARALKMNKMINANGRNRQLMLYWFWTRSGVITSEYGLKINLAKNSLFRKPTDAAFVRIDLPFYGEDQHKTLQIASDFIQQFFPAIRDVLPFEQ